MSYKHFIAALAVAFLCFIGTIAAQKSKNQFSQAEFEKLVIDNAPKAFKLAQAKKLNLEQLKFFMYYEGSNERNLHYCEPLLELYWQQLTHKDKLNFITFRDVEYKYRYKSTNKEGLYFNTVFAYLVANQAEFKQAWGDSLYHSFVLDCLDDHRDRADMTTFTGNKMSIAERTNKAEKYLAFIKKQLPDYEPQSRAYIEYDYLYPYTENAEKHYQLAYEYLNKYEPVAKEFHSEAFAICFSEVNQNTKKIGLNFINKALELEPQREYYICKAELLYQLNRIDEARQALAISQKNAPDVEDSNALYYRRVKALLDAAR